MGEALRRLDWPRWSYVLTTKVFWGIHDDGNMTQTRSIASTCCRRSTASLERFGQDFVDVFYCHRPTRTRRSRRPCGR